MGDHIPRNVWVIADGGHENPLRHRQPDPFSTIPLACAAPGRRLITLRSFETAHRAAPPQDERSLHFETALRASSVRTELQLGLGEGGGEVGAAHEVAVEAAGRRLIHDEPIMVLRLVRPLVGGQLVAGLYHRPPFVMEAALPFRLAKRVAE